MRINFDLNPQSINKVIADLEKVKKQLSTSMMSDFLEQVCKWLIHRANYYLKNSDIGDNVKADIEQGWTYSVNGSTAVITNKAEKAVFVEFGVGLIGASIPHENAEESGYKYNVNNRGRWSFIVKDVEDVDMHLGYKVKKIPMTEYGDLQITTAGSWRVMYAFQAILDAREDLQKPNGEFKTMWETVKARYI